EVDHKAEQVVAHLAEERRPNASSVRKVDLALEASYQYPVPLRGFEPREAHSRRRRPMSTSVPAAVVFTFTTSISDSIIVNPRPRSLPRGARQLPPSRTVSVTWPSPTRPSTSKNARPGR